MKFTLRQLEARLLKRCDDGSSETVHSLDEADGVLFLCPLCFSKNGKIGTHSVLCWFEDKVPDDLDPKPGRWKPQGTGIDDMTFIVGKKSNSVLLTNPQGCGWHGFIHNGKATLS